MFLKIQAMTNNSYKGFLAISKIANARTGIERDSLIKERMLFTGKNDLLISDLMKNIDTNIVDKQSLSQMIAARETYKKNYGFLVTHLQGNSDSIYYFFNRVLAPCFFNYQDKIAEFITINKENYLKSSSQISADVDQKSLFMLLFGFSPLIVFIVYLLLLGIVLIWLLRKGTDELMNS
jgi:hypothetical protein